MDHETAKLLRTAFDAYLVQLGGGRLDPSGSYLPYEFDHIDDRVWHLLGSEMVKDELREITNILNHWHGSLHRWQAWNRVVGAYGTEEAWEIRREFVEALAHECLLKPSATRDCLTFVATNSLHQVRLASDKGYRDYLEGDPTAPGDKPKNLTRRQKEKRLADLASHWPESVALMALLRRIDDRSYRQATSDYRNRSSHAIGPRLGIGFTRAVVRSVVPATKLTKQRDGTYKPVSIPGKMSVSYGYGGTAPLDMEAARIANLEQYHRARNCYEQYTSFLAAAMASMPRAERRA